MKRMEMTTNLKSCIIRLNEYIAINRRSCMKKHECAENPTTKLQQWQNSSVFGEIRGKNYTQKHWAIIKGEIDAEDAPTRSLGILYQKAIANGDILLAEKIKPVWEMKQTLNSLVAPYSKKQLKIISGKIPMTSVTGHVLAYIYKKALSNNDEELAKKIKWHLDLKKDEARKRGNRTHRNRIAMFKNGETVQWRQPKSNNYTDRQKQVVRGEIPYRDTRGIPIVKSRKSASVGICGLKQICEFSSNHIDNHTSLGV